MKSASAGRLLPQVDMGLDPLNALEVPTPSSSAEVDEGTAQPLKPRVLHVLGSLTIGGIQMWLMHMLRHRDQFSVEHEILLTKAEPGAYEEEARRIGVPIHKLPIGPGKLSWLRGFRKFLNECGPFDIIHSHAYLFSAPVLAAGKAERIPVRIAHCHAARSRGTSHQTLRHKLRRALAIAWLKRSSTRRIGISEAAIEEIDGAGWRNDPAASVLLYGFDFSRFRGAGERAAQLRRELGIGKDVPVVGHVGRFDPVKNHAFLLQAFASLLERMPEAQLVLVGDGPVRKEVQELAKSLGLSDRVHFSGATDEVPAFMAMFHLFTLTSFSEGLGIVCLEAQAAGTPAIVSDAVPREVSIVPGAVTHLPLAVGADAWAREMRKSLQQPKRDADDWLGQVEASRFGLKRCIAELDAIYTAELAG